MNLRSRLFGLLALAVGAGTIAIAQAGSSQPQDPPPQVFRTQANFVRVDAYPTRNGQPVLDLKAEDFEVFEDDKPQNRRDVRARPRRAGRASKSQRSEPNSIEASRQLIANPRNRVFVLFLDTTARVARGLVARARAADPVDRSPARPRRSRRGHDAANVGRRRRLRAKDGGPRRRASQHLAVGNTWHVLEDEREKQYESCYPNMEQAGVVAEMKARRHERNTLDAMRELVLYLRDMREERKAIVTVSEGWLLFRPNAGLTILRKDPLHRKNRADSRSGSDLGRPRWTDHDETRNAIGNVLQQSECDAERQYLSSIDDATYFRDIMGEANRANATFYTVDPRGLPVFDTPMGPAAPVPIAVDAAMLRAASIRFGRSRKAPMAWRC